MLFAAAEYQAAKWSVLSDRQNLVSGIVNSTFANSICTKAGQSERLGWAGGWGPGSSGMRMCAAKVPRLAEATPPPLLTSAPPPPPAPCPGSLRLPVRPPRQLRARLLLLWPQLPRRVRVSHCVSVLNQARGQPVVAAL